MADEGSEFDDEEYEYEYVDEEEPEEEEAPAAAAPVTQNLLLFFALKNKNLLKLIKIAF